MDRFKRKINLIMMVGLCLFATTFGIGASTLINSVATYANAQTIEEESDVSASDVNSDLDAGVSANATVIIDGAYYMNTTSQAGSESAPAIGGTNLQNATVHITNSLFEFSTSGFLGNLSGANVEISNSIFVYTGTASNATLFSNAPTSITLENVALFATNSGTISTTWQDD